MTRALLSLWREYRTAQRCKEKLSLCLDCSLHNRCRRYSKHRMAVKSGHENEARDWFKEKRKVER